MRVVYVDCSLLFGMQSASKLYTAVAEGMACVQFFRSTHFLMHYLDDFLFIGTTGSLDAARTMDKASAVVRDLGVLVSAHKSDGGPACAVSFLRLVVDTWDVQLRLLDDNVACMNKLVHSWQGRHSCTQ